MSLPGLFLACFAAVIIYMSVWFAVGRRANRLDVADTAWGGGFIAIATVCLFASANNRSVLAWLLVGIWGLRLASHIWKRNAFKGPDKRYEELSAKWSKERFWLRAFLSVFLLQAGLIFLVALPVIVVAGQPTRPLGIMGLVAVLLWVFGFLFEFVADRQLARFLQDHNNKGKVLQEGLWKYSRHPNYFGELVQWWAISLLALGSSNAWLALAGPAVLTYLIIFVSGIPPIEKRHNQKPGYTKYKERTSVIIPLPPKS